MHGQNYIPWKTVRFLFFHAMILLPFKTQMLHLENVPGKTDKMKSMLVESMLFPHLDTHKSVSLGNQILRTNKVE